MAPHLRALSPLLHAAYVPILQPTGRTGRDPLRPEERAELDALLARRDTERDESALDVIDRTIVARTWWYAIQPDEVARAVLRTHGWRSPLTVEQATLVVLAIAEAGYPIVGNGAPDYDYDSPDSELPPVRGEARQRVLPAAAAHWARMASQRITYVSFGDARGYMPRAVQYDEPGSMHPGQRSALCLGPAEDRRSHEYMRRHTRRLLLVRGAE